MTSENATPWASYDHESLKYFESYRGLYFSNIHRQFVKYLPNRINAKVLDIGCGSGRDALSLARRGYLVTAVDPSIKMLDLARLNNSHHNIRWLEDRLPELSKLEKNKYEFVLLSAVWMHVPPHERSAAIFRISDLLENGGHVAVSLRLGKPDPKRMMHPVSLEEILLHASNAGLSAIYCSKKHSDPLNRKEVCWQKVVLKKS
jgi:2-polyprenyl-3-methyl-5-hydroxy-6-metoxy-1,4-benzoquinol methylase